MVLKDIMELFVFATSSVRAIIVTAFLILNTNSLANLFRHKRYCLHRLTAGIVYLGNVVYLVTWIPFVVYGILNGMTLVVSAETYCLVQNWVSHGFGTLLLGVLAVRTVELLRLRTNPSSIPMSPVHAGTLLFVVCFLPQILLRVVLASLQPEVDDLSFQFLDDVTRLQWSDNETEYRVGFLICQQELTPHIVRAYYFHFRAVVLPMAVLIFVCTLGRFLVRRRSSSTQQLCSKMQSLSLPTVQPMVSHIPFDGTPRACPMDCDRRLVVIDLIMCSNFAWQAFIRPLMVLHSIHVSDEMMSPPATFLDFGSHLVLTLSAVFAPSITLSGYSKPEGKSPFFIELPVTDITKFQTRTICDAEASEDEKRNLLA